MASKEQPLSHLPLEVVRMIIHWTVILLDQNVGQAANLRLVNRLFDYEIFEALYATGAFGSHSLDGKVSGHRFPVPPSYRRAFEDGKIVPFLARFISRNLKPLCPISRHLNELVDRILPWADELTRFDAIGILCYQIHHRHNKSHMPGWEAGILCHASRPLVPAMRSATLEDEFRSDQDVAAASVLLASTKEKNVAHSRLHSWGIDEAAPASLLFGTPLYVAICARQHRLARHLLGHDASSTTTLYDGLKAATRNDDLDMVDLLLKSPSQAACTGEDFQLAIVEAARHGRAMILNRLLGLLKDDDRRVDLQCSLWWAALHNHPDIARILVDEWDADADSKCVSDGRRLDDSPWNMSPAMLAAWMGHPDVLRFFLRANARRRGDRERGHAGQYFQAAITGNKVASIEVIFCEAGAATTSVTGSMPTMEEWAKLLCEGLELGCREAVHSLITQRRVLGWPGPAFRPTLSAGLYAVMRQACYLGDRATVAMLVEAGVPAEMKGEAGWSASAGLVEDPKARELMRPTFVSHRPWVNITVTRWNESS